MPTPRVFWSVTPNQTKSPYIRDLAAAISARGWDVETLSLRELLSSSHETVHVQWPEHVSRGQSVAATAAKHARAVGLLAALRLRKHSVVLTAHNRAPHGHSDAIDAWFRGALQKLSAATIVLVPGHEAELREMGAIAENSLVRTIPHPVLLPKTQAQIEPAETSDLLIVLGQIHPYHLIEEFIDALDASGSTRPVLVAGGVGDQELAERLQERAASCDWIDVRLGFADDDILAPYMTQAAAIVSLQRNTFNSGGPFFALPRGLPIIMSAGAQADDLVDHVGKEWVFSVSEPVGSIDVDELDRWLEGTRTVPNLERFSLEAIAASHIELYELLRF